MDTIIDTDALIGIFNSKDLLHSAAKKEAKKLKNKGYNTLVLPTTLAEFATVAGKEIGYKEAQMAVGNLIKSGIPIIEISQELVKEAVIIYTQQNSKKDTLFDCFIIAAAKRRNIKYIFSFDDIYSKKINDLKLVTELV